MAVDLFNEAIMPERYRGLTTPALPELPSYRSPYVPRVDGLDPQPFERPWEGRSETPPPPVAGTAPPVIGPGETVGLFNSAAELVEDREGDPFASASDAYAWSAGL